MDYDYSPTAWRKITYAGTQSVSFPQAARDLEALAELTISQERVRRATERIGQERVAERDAQATAYTQMPFPERRQLPTDVPTPVVACVQMDGGRLQYFDRKEPERNEEETFWREMKVGCVWSMTSDVSGEDPCPQLPKSFVDPERMHKMVREIKGFSGPDALTEGSAEQVSEEPRMDERPGRPQPLARSVIATRHPVEMFGELLASESHQRHFVAAQRKAFVADGSETNWGVWRRHLSDYVPIVDFIHVLTYVYSAAMVGSTPQEGWQAYREWAQYIWSGEVDRVIAALALKKQALGEPNRVGPPRRSPNLPPESHDSCVAKKAAGRTAPSNTTGGRMTPTCTSPTLTTSCRVSPCTMKRGTSNHVPSVRRSRSCSRTASRTESLADYAGANASTD